MLLEEECLGSSITHSYVLPLKPTGFSMLVTDGTHSHFSWSAEDQNINAPWEL